MASSSCQKKLSRSKSGLRIVPVKDELTSPFVLREPEWIPDNECSECVSCQSKFDFMHRRHHCRRCGQCFCKQCCNNMVLLPRMCFVDPVRQCIECAKISGKENEFFDKHTKTLVIGAPFKVNSSLSDSENDNASTYSVKLSADHRFLQFDNPDGYIDHEEIELKQIDGFKILTAGTDAMGNTTANGLMLKYSDPRGEKQVVRMVAVETQKRQPMAWVACMQKAIKLVYEGRGLSVSNPTTPTTPTTPPSSTTGPSSTGDTP